MIFIGIDIAKNSHFASAVNSDGEVLVKPFSFENSKDGFNIFINKFKNYSVDECFVGLESTGHYGDNLINYLFPKGFKIGMINAIQTNSLRNSNIRKTKNDKIDTFLISKCLILGNYTLIQEKDINIIKLRTLCRFRFDIIQSQTRLKTQLTSCLDLVFPELYHFFKGNLHLNTSYKLLEKYSTPKEISKVRIDTLTKLFSSASRGKYRYEDAERIKKLAKESIGIDNTAISIQIKFLIKQLNLLKEQINDIDKNIKNIMDELNSTILTIPGVGYTIGAIILSEIGNINRFSNPTNYWHTQV